MEQVAVNSERNTFREKLQAKADSYAHAVYQTTKSFPKEELYGITSQLRRSALSVPLNCIEGYARQRSRIYVNFLEMAYGSLKESKYLLEFSAKEGYLPSQKLVELNQAAEELGAMLWAMIGKVKKSNA
jgi:four helix bundle protein